MACAFVTGFLQMIFLGTCDATCCRTAMRTLALLMMLSASSVVCAQVRLQVMPPVAEPEEHSTLARRFLLQTRLAVQRCFEQHEGVGEGVLELQLDVRASRVARIVVISEDVNLLATQRNCVVETLRRVQRFSPAIRRVHVRLRYEYPDPPPQVARALAAQHNARLRGRCLLDAANELRAAARAVRDRRGRARARALRRLQEAEQLLAQCEGFGLGLEVDPQNLLNPQIPPGFPGCPGCLGQGAGLLRKQ